MGNAVATGFAFGLGLLGPAVPGRCAALGVGRQSLLGACKREVRVVLPLVVQAFRLGVLL